MATLNYKSLGEVPEDLREFAKETDDGQFHVKVAPQDKITEFRENNVKIAKERDELLTTIANYEGVTGVPLSEIERLDDFAKEFEALRDVKKRVDNGKLVEDTSLEEATQQRVTDVTNTMRTQIADMAKERDAWKDKATKADQRADRMQVENAIRLAASDAEVGMLDNAVPMVLPEAFNTFRVEEGKLIAKAADGTIHYGSDGVNPMSVKEWLLKQRDSNAFLFKGSKGGGAAGGDDKVAGRLNQAELAKMSPQQRINYARKNGLL